MSPHTFWQMVARKAHTLARNPVGACAISSAVSAPAWPGSA